MSYQEASELSRSWGLVFLMVLFLGSVAYALWPSNRAKFTRAAAMPLDDEPCAGEDAA